MAKRLLLLMIFLLVSASAWAAPAPDAAVTPPLESLAQCRALCDLAAQGVAKGDLNAVLEPLRPHYAIGQDEERILAMQFFSQRETIRAKGDALISVTYLGRQEAGEGLIRFNYLENYNKTSLVWQFTFYKPADRWLVRQLRWQENLDALFR